MKRWRRRSDWAASRQVRGGLVALGGISLILVLSVVYLFVLLTESRRSMETSIREDAIWAAYQTDRQASRMIEVIDRALLEGRSEDLAEVIRAYDILYSRAQLLEDGSFALRFDDTSNLAALAAQTREGILGLAAHVDFLPAGSSFPYAALGRLREAVAAIQADTTELLLQTNVAQDKVQVAQRAEVRQIETALGTSVALLVAGFAGIVGLLAFQLRHIAAAGRKLARLGERNRASAARARAASQAKSTFLATMSHEIRTPLNGIIGASDLLARSDLTSTQERQLLMIRQSGYHLLEVISDILDFSKLESGKVDFEIQRVRMPEIAETLISVISPRAELKNLRLSVDLPVVELGTDPARLRQVLVNLAGNAVKFTAEGHVSVHGWLLTEDVLRIEVADTGIGITPEALPLLFREFSQVDGSASRSFGGSGLGLAICKRIVEGLGGRIGVRSQPYSGSVFWFDLPVTDPKPCQASIEDRKASSPIQQDAYVGRVLVVEDNPINSAVAHGLLTWLGVEVDLAGNGAIAVKKLSRETFDLVLMDVQMPVLSGIEATRELRRLGNSVRIVGLTGNAFVQDRTECLRAGMDDFLAKPVTEQKLAQALYDAGLQQRTEASPSSLDDQGEVQDPRGGLQIDARLSSFGKYEVSISEPTTQTHNPFPKTGGDALKGIDSELIATLIQTLGWEAVVELLGDVRNEANDLPDAIEHVEDQSYSEQHDALLHSMKGACATLGLSEAAARIQEARNFKLLTRDDAERLRDHIHRGVGIAVRSIQTTPD